MRAPRLVHASETVNVNVNVNANNLSDMSELCHPEEGDLRLVDRLDINGFATGALQVFIDGAFGAVCNTLFGPLDAEVACRQMGFAGGTDLPLALNGLGILPEVEVLLLFFPVVMPT